MSLLTEQEIRDIANSVKEIGENSDRALILAAQKAVIEKIKEQRLVGYMHPLDVGRFLNLTSERVSDEQVPVVALLPEGD